MFFSFFFFTQKTAYEMRISYWSSDVCSSDLERPVEARRPLIRGIHAEVDADRAGRRRQAQPPLDQPATDTAALQPRQQVDVQMRRVVQIGRASCRERVCQYV